MVATVCVFIPDFAGTNSLGVLRALAASRVITVLNSALWRFRFRGMIGAPFL